MFENFINEVSVELNGINGLPYFVGS